MTIAETILWRALRGSRFKDLKFRRQVPVGPYVADFLCTSRRLIIELDGPPHDKEEQRAHDRKRDADLRAKGFTVLRFPNDLIIGGCDLALAQIDEAEKEKPGVSAGLTPPPPPAACPRCDRKTGVIPR
jgi:very-short-patch-repair endonuclease